MRFGISIAAALMAAGLSGCGGGGISGLVPVTGTVTLNDQPFEGAEITFVPDESNKDGRPANDVTGPAGNYKVMTNGRAGLVPGKYKVFVSKSIIDKSTVHEDMQDDPYMIALSQGLEMSDISKDPAMISGEFDRDVPSEGGIQDFDVKSSQ